MRGSGVGNSGEETEREKSNYIKRKGSDFVRGREGFAKTRVCNYVSKQRTTHSRKLKAHNINRL